MCLQMRADSSAADAQARGVEWHGRDVWCGEPLFVADGGGADEDDGCVLCTCYDAAEKRSFLLVLQVRQALPTLPVSLSLSFSQASTMTELARAYAPTTIPLGLHALYADAATSGLA
jgi:carotenoid cleavage dioxygenase-like enzyme